MFAPGKKVLGKLRETLQEKYNISFLELTIVQEFKKEEIPSEKLNFLKNFNYLKRFLC